MGLVRKHKIGDGMIVLGRGKYAGKNIDITLLEIGGTEYHRVARLNIKGIEGISKPLEVSADEGYIDLDEEFRIRVSNGSDWREDLRGSSLFIDYDAPKESYKMNRKESKRSLTRNPDEQPWNITNANSPVGYHYKEEWKKYMR
jgi:hypothetical protein